MSIKAILGVAGVDAKENKKAVKVGQYLSAAVLVALVATLVQVVVDYSSLAEEKLWLSILIWGIFALELVVNLYLVNDKKRYLKNNWLNVLIVVIAFPWISVTSEWAPVLRILRLALFLRVFTDIFWDVIKVLRRNNFGLILVIASIFIALSGAIFSVIEDTNLATGLWYALVTVTTVGYGDVTPITEKGRLFGVLLIVFGVVLFSLVTANISAFLIGSRQRRVENEILKYVQTAQENLEKQERRNEEQLNLAIESVVTKLEQLQQEQLKQDKENISQAFLEMEEKLLLESKSLKEQINLLETSLK